MTSSQLSTTASIIHNPTVKSVVSRIQRGSSVASLSEKRGSVKMFKEAQVQHKSDMGSEVYLSFLSFCLNGCAVIAGASRSTVTSAFFSLSQTFASVYSLSQAMCSTTGARTLRLSLLTGSCSST